MSNTVLPHIRTRRKKRDSRLKNANSAREAHTREKIFVAGLAASLAVIILAGLVSGCGDTAAKGIKSA
jgi:lipid II:glycine glycyltransferase (peptidoglycan interpeptide bridge formation enzyme)